MWARRAAWWVGRGLRALVALPSLLAVSALLYFTAAYSWYFIEQGGWGVVPLVALVAVSLVAIAIACLPVISWIRRSRRQPLRSNASAEASDGCFSRDERVVLVDVLWAVAPVVWLALPLAIGVSVMTANCGSVGALLHDPSSRVQVVLFGTLVLTYTAMWISWARFIARRSRGQLSPPSPGMRLVDPDLPAARRRSTLLLTVILLLSTVLSLLQFTWYIAAPLLLW